MLSDLKNYMNWQELMTLKTSFLCLYIELNEDKRYKTNRRKKYFNYKKKLSKKT
jgi:hypothetical protein